MRKTNLLLCATLCASITLSACSDDPAPSGNNATPDMSVAPDMPVTPTDMNTTPDQDTTPDMDTTDLPVTSDMDEPSDLTPANFPTKFGEAVCAQAERCCSPQQYTENFSGMDCFTEFGEFYVLALPTSDDVMAGKLEFDATIAQRALDQLAAASCDDVEVVPNIPLPYVGKVAPGGACALTFDCAEPAEGEVSCDGTCVVTKTKMRGEACADDEDCDLTSYCGADDTCAAQQAVGADCADDRECTSSFCDVTGSGKCGAQRALGAACTQARECVSGYCSDDTSTCVSSGVYFCE